MLKERLVRKLILLTLLLMGTAALITPAKPAYALICCSACDADPIPLPCYHGCSPSC
ncbi:MAG TPA: hypothetical protein VIJ26_07375 [Thermoanaerobaculia bacterium]